MSKRITTVIDESLDKKLYAKHEHYWPPNGSYFCIYCGADIQKNITLVFTQGKKHDV